MPPPTPAPGGTFRRPFLAVSLIVVALGLYGFFQLGPFLAKEDALRKADAILVLSGTPLRRPLEAADLYLAGYAPRIVLTRETEEAGASALAARGIPFAEDVTRLAGYAPRIVLTRETEEAGASALAARGIPFAEDVTRAHGVFLQLGIPNEAIVIPEQLHGSTAAEAITLRELATRQGWRLVIVVSSEYHLRRAGFALRRELRGTDIQIVMRGTRYEGFEPDQWWRRRADIREIIPELPKLVAYVLGLGA